MNKTILKVGHVYLNSLSEPLVITTINDRIEYIMLSQPDKTHNGGKEWAERWLRKYKLEEYIK